VFLSQNLGPQTGVFVPSPPEYFLRVPRGILGGGPHKKKRGGCGNPFFPHFPPREGGNTKKRFWELGWLTTKGCFLCPGREGANLKGGGANNPLFSPRQGVVSITQEVGYSQPGDYPHRRRRGVFTKKTWWENPLLGERTTQRRRIVRYIITAASREREYLKRVVCPPPL